MLIKSLSIQLPVKDVEKSVSFFKKAGFSFREEDTNEKIAPLLINDTIAVLLVCEVYFMTYTNREIANAHRQTEVVITVEVENKKEVKQIVENALLAGAKIPLPPQEKGTTYQWGFHDPDGHLWEIKCLL